MTLLWRGQRSAGGDAGRFRGNLRDASSDAPVPRKLQHALERANPIVFTVFAGLAGFVGYFCMYAFRKPFSVALYTEVAGWHFTLDYTIAWVISKVLGYALSKLIGEKEIAEIRQQRRAAAILGLITISWVALIL